MPMSDHVDRYVAIKRALGYSFIDQALVLKRFAAFAAGDEFLNTARVITWASLASSQVRSAEWFRVARNFAIAMHAEDERHEIPPRDVFGKARRLRPPPHILAVEDIERVMRRALLLPPTASLTPYTYYYLFGLLATTGLRVSEATSLVRTDLGPDGLVIRETKFHKSRLVPIAASTQSALAAYLRLRGRIGGADPHVFVLSNGKPPDHATVTRTFVKLARACGLRSSSGRGPRLHDLRHSFAVRSLERCGSDRGAVDRHMLALSTYLGHASIADTYWYLEATPVLTRQIALAAEALSAGSRS
ncbi:Tyrosine recombinase XerC [Xylophilus ampelinus]|jgi:integrase/recombinase XerD|nr:tyrosine-type recombinase/integrase [Variovorax sp.]VTY25268.1 Tyrosine recombinase XerC [Xylophilus ampelinus]|tara:strand:+ start:1850 stop:2758 length:909 start_codon:yes stop_codon:yes gene_type:complete